MKTLQQWCADMLPVIQAAANGEAIQSSVSGGAWFDVKDDCPAITPSLMYRVKPAKKKKKKKKTRWRQKFITGATSWLVMRLLLKEMAEERQTMQSGKLVLLMKLTMDIFLLKLKTLVEFAFTFKR